VQAQGGNDEPNDGVLGGFVHGAWGFQVIR
jgi:hypothetical protein